jgi:hypothetical protein
MNTDNPVLSKEDKKQLAEKGLNLKDAEKQINAFKTGFPSADITAAATPEKGILCLRDEDLKHYIEKYKSALQEETVLKFVPASGAASRMFKLPMAFIHASENADELLLKPEYKPVKEIFDNIEKFAFYQKLKALCESKGINIQKDKKETLKLLLTEEGLNYGNLPNALLLFHRYESGNRTSAEEHFVEAINYAGANGKAKLHFTVSEEHVDLFNRHSSRLKEKYSESRNFIFNIDHSLQKPHTDTIAVNLENRPFRTEEGKLFFRPGGHGALIENLNDLKADIVFVKNIDNVVPDRMKPDTYTYKKALGGVLVEARDAVFDFLKALDKSSDNSITEKAKKYLEERFSFIFSEKYEGLSDKKKKKYVHNILDRPIRVCGMVKNEGEPGGGPFFVKNKEGEESLQIVEMSQINTNDPEKLAIVNSATHFNPVDLVLALKNYKGELFNLLDYIDPDTGFISIKSQNGKDLKAQELPGLWNGAMANWNTVFVEVPVSTFNPVKTVNDLLREQHLQ